MVLVATVLDVHDAPVVLVAVCYVHPTAVPVSYAHPTVPVYFSMHGALNRQV